MQTLPSILRLGLAKTSVVFLGWQNNKICPRSSSGCETKIQCSIFAFWVWDKQPYVPCSSFGWKNTYVLSGSVVVVVFCFCFVFLGGETRSPCSVFVFWTRNKTSIHCIRPSGARQKRLSRVRLWSETCKVYIRPVFVWTFGCGINHVLRSKDEKHMFHVLLTQCKSYIFSSYWDRETGCSRFLLPYVEG